MNNQNATAFAATAALVALIAVPLSSQAQDLGVCDAYLQLLQQTKFAYTPFCGRPDDGVPHDWAKYLGTGKQEPETAPLPGFARLTRQDWDIERVWPIFINVYEFILFDDQSHRQKFFVPAPEPGEDYTIDEKGAHWSAAPDTKKGLIQSIQFNWTNVWSYAEPVDIDNDGAPLNMMVWQGYGVSQEGRVCGANYNGEDPWPYSYVAQQAFIVEADGKTIDENRTRAIFGAPTESSPARLARKPSGNPRLAKGAIPFEPLGDSIGIFEYRDKFYIQTEDKPKDRDAPMPPVEVWLREHGQTTKLCSLDLTKDKPVPESH